MPSMEPVHLMRWITDHPHFFRPPVANKEVFPCRACGTVLPVPAGA